MKGNSINYCNFLQSSQFLSWAATPIICSWHQKLLAMPLPQKGVSNRHISCQQAVKTAKFKNQSNTVPPVI
jgi:hypothetical protein